MFKAWCKDSNKWLDNFNISSDGSIFRIEFGEEFYLDRAVLCRSTGLKDKNGVEIFENDIVRFYIEGVENKDNIDIGFIRYSERSGAFMIKVNASMSVLLCENIPKSMGIIDPETNIEIIGNVFQNKNLLETKND